MLKSLFAASFLLFAAQLAVIAADSSPSVVISVPDQKLVVVQNGVSIASYPVSTSRFGIGDRPKTYCTPLGKLEVVAKIGSGAREGTVFHGCRPTGEVVRPNSAGRDPIVTRILRLRGLEAQNARAYARGIYIHGTPQESRIGRPASYGCIRMRSRDVVRVFDTLPVGTDVQIVNTSISRALHEVATRGTLANNAG